MDDLAENDRSVVAREARELPTSHLVLKNEELVELFHNPRAPLEDSRLEKMLDIIKRSDAKQPPEFNILPCQRCAVAMMKDPTAFCSHMSSEYHSQTFSRMRERVCVGMCMWNLDTDMASQTRDTWTSAPGGFPM